MKRTKQRRKFCPSVQQLMQRGHSAENAKEIAAEFRKFGRRK